MSKTFKEKFAEFFQRGLEPEGLTENSSLHEIALEHEYLPDFIERKYGVKIDVTDKPLSLVAFADKYGLPPAPILLAEVQTAKRTQGVKEVDAIEAKKLLETCPQTRILDVREEWEVKLCRLPSSQVLSPQLLDEILMEWPKETPVLLYCHLGIRSLDAATFLADRGFTNVYSLHGGIESWSVNVDPTIPRYENAWC